MAINIKPFYYGWISNNYVNNYGRYQIGWISIEYVIEVLENEKRKGYLKNR
jgi:hypothetical protein